MKFNKNIFFGLALAGTLISTSCQKDFLDRKPLNLVSEETVWNDPNLIKLSVNEFYTFLHTGFATTYLPAGITDDLQLIGPEERKVSTYLTGDFLSTAFPERNLWKDSYAQIRKINYFINRAETASVLNEDDKKLVIGQARFMRAYLYFRLFSSFKDVPLILKAQPIEEAEEKPEKVAHKDGMTFISSELEKAAQELPSTYSKEEWGRITKEAALAFRTRVLLWNASPLNNIDNDKNAWIEAADAAEEVMKTGKFALQKEYDNVFLVKNIMNTPEVILEFRYNGLKGERQHNFDKNNSPTGYGGRGMNCPTQDLVDSYEMANGKTIYEAGSGYDKNNPYIDRDPRFEKSILYNGVAFKDRPIETFNNGKDMPRLNPTPTGYYMRKFIDENFDYNKDASIASSTNWVIMRYAEVLLNFAEAKNEAEGPIASVYDAVNAIRKRVNMPALPEGLSQNQMRERIYRERRVELAFEDHIRYNDLKRWKTAEKNLNTSVRGVTIIKNTDGSFTYNEKLAGQRTFIERNYWLPIPLVELGVNSNLNPQNPGW